MTSHIQFLDDERTAWCKIKLNLEQHYFKDLDHAIYNGLYGGKKVVCEQCLIEVNKILKNG